MTSIEILKEYLIGKTVEFEGKEGVVVNVEPVYDYDGAWFHFIFKSGLTVEVAIGEDFSIKE